MTRLIDADALMEDVAKVKYFRKIQAKRIIDAQPTIDAVPVRHGKWIPKILKFGGRDYVAGMKCSACGEDALETEGDEYLTDYCPNCGARMDKDE